jgi:hypothetical protein
MNLDERLQKDLSPDIYCLVHNKIVNLEQQCKKQKEVINKANEWVRNWMHGTNDWFEEDSKPSELLDILKVSK